MGIDQVSFSKFPVSPPYRGGGGNLLADDMKVSFLKFYKKMNLKGNLKLSFQKFPYKFPGNLTPKVSYHNVVGNRKMRVRNDSVSSPLEEGFKERPTSSFQKRKKAV